MNAPPRKALRALVDYDALLEEHGVPPDEMALRKEARRLADAARNLETLTELAEREAVAAAAADAPKEK